MLFLRSLRGLAPLPGNVKRQQYAKASMKQAGILFEETWTNDEPENSENCVDEGENRIEERETVESILSENLKMDAETQTTEPKEGTVTSLTQQIVDLESNLERAKQRIESL